MEFFDLMNIPQFIISYFTVVSVETAEEYAAYLLRYYAISLFVTVGLYLVLLILGGIGLRTMAKRAGLDMKGAWMAFVPFLNTYYTGKIAGETHFFGQKMKRAGLYAMLLEIFYVALEIFYLTSEIILVKAHPYSLVYNNEYGYFGWEFNEYLLPNSLQWLYTAQYYTDLIAYLSWFVLLVFMCVLFTALFRKYYARSPVLMTFLCAIMPFRGIVLFAVRKNTPVDYNAYMRRRAEEFARRHQPPYGGGNDNGYNGNNSGFNGTPPDDPFNEFGSNSSGNTPDDPFDEFKNGN